MVRKLGIDIGKVIINRFTEGEKEMPGAISSIASIVQNLGAENVFLVSACDDGGEKNMAWFKEHRFLEQTGFCPANIRFCEGRDLKAGIAKELGLTDFLDDRLPILRGMQDSVKSLWNFRPAKYTASIPDHGVPGLRVVENWEQFLSAFKATS